ncbi:unnamed protein product [Arabidopsis halleri]
MSTRKLKTKKKMFTRKPKIQRRRCLRGNQRCCGQYH